MRGGEQTRKVCSFVIRKNFLQGFVVVVLIWFVVLYFQRIRYSHSRPDYQPHHTKQAQELRAQSWAYCQSR